LVAVAVDAKGNTNSSSPVTLTVSNPTATATADTTPPTVAIVNPTNGSKIGNGSVTVKGSASDAGGLSMVKLSIDGTTVASGNSGTISYKWAAGKAAAGSHTITINATDKAGNTSSASIIVTK
jgi:thermitase